MSNDEVLDTVVADLREGTCVPFVGAGAAADLLPSGAELAKRLLERHRNAKPNAPAFPGDAGDLARVAQFIAVDMRANSRPKHWTCELLESDLRNMRERELPLIYRVLARCTKVPIYATTNYDGLLREALTRAGRKPVQFVPRWHEGQIPDAPPKEGAMERPSGGSPLVFHMHGSMDQPDSLVLTEDDYIAYTIALARELTVPPAPGAMPVVPLGVRSAFARHSLLFIGYSLSDVDLRITLATLVRSFDLAGSREHVAIQLKSSDQALLEYTERHFHWSYRVRVIWRNVKEFADELDRRLGGGGP